VAVDETGTGDLHTSLEVLASLESAELGEGNSLLDVLAGDISGGDLLHSFGNVLAGGRELFGLSGNSDGEETSVRVGVVLGRDLDLREALGGLREEREARGPFDSRLTTKEGSQNGSLGLVARRTERAGTGEGDDNRVAGLARNALLTAIVLRRHALPRPKLAEAGTGRKTGEELTNPLGQLSRLRTAGNEGNVRLGICSPGELRNGFSGQVFLEWCSRGGGEALSETAVECQAVCRIKSQGLRVRQEGLLLELDDVQDDLV